MEIKIGKSGRTCAASGREFIHGEEVVSLVRINNNELVREDYGREAWSQDRSSAAVAVWTNKYIDPSVLAQQPEEVFSPLRRIFYDASVSEERAELAVAYLAAQLLRRQKVFRLIKESEDLETGIRYCLFTDRIGDKLIEVRDPNLTYAEMDEGRKVLIERLTRFENPEQAGEQAPDVA